MNYEFLTSGPYYYKRYIQLINDSKGVIHLQIYTFENDATGKRVQKALIDASKRGVSVNVVLDGFGSGHLPQDFLDDFTQNGITLRFFSKLKFSLPLRLGRRLHQKLLVIDSEHAIVGGINIADRYNGDKEESPWLDFAIYLSSPECVRLHNLAERILNRKRIKRVRLTNHWADKNSEDFSKLNVLENDFFRNKLQIRRSYNRAIRNTRDTIVIFASYFFPGYKQLKYIERALSRGVEVHLILPRKTDVLFYHTAVKYYYGRLLRKGVRIYEYTRAILHAKVAVADGYWCTVGSYNLNDLSDMLSVELNVEVFDERFAKKFHNQLSEIIEKDCEEISKNDYVKAPFYIQLWYALYYFVVIQSLKVLYWLTDKHKEYQIE